MEKMISVTESIAVGIIFPLGRLVEWSGIDSRTFIIGTRSKQEQKKETTQKPQYILRNFGCHKTERIKTYRNTSSPGAA